MTTVLFYGYANCDSCRKAKKWLTEQGLSFTEYDITKTPPTEPQLKAMLACYDGKVKALFNTAGKAYRAGDWKTKLPAMTEADALSALSRDGYLVKRPFLLKGQQGAVGFKSEVWQKLFG